MANDRYASLNDQNPYAAPREYGTKRDSVPVLPESRWNEVEVALVMGRLKPATCGRFKTGHL